MKDLAKSIDLSIVLEAKNHAARAARLRATRALVRRVLRIVEALPSAGDIRAASIEPAWAIYGDNSASANVSLFLEETRADTALLREMVSTLHVKIAKSPGYGGALTASFEVDTVEFTIYGYRPATANRGSDRGACDHLDECPYWWPENEHMACTCPGRYPEDCAEDSDPQVTQ